MNFKFLLYESDQLSIKQKFEIIDLFGSTFSNKLTLKMFDWKYINNPFGNSLHLLGYCENELVLNRSFWKVNNINKFLYQCVDTCVSPKIQGKGVFKASQLFLEENHNDLRYYNLPNKKSMPVYLKLGWKIIKKTKIKLTVPSLLKDRSLSFNDNEINWRYNLHPNKIYYKIKQGNGYIICFLKYSCLPIALGYTRLKPDLKTIFFPLVFSYDKNVRGLTIPKYNNIIISKNSNEEVSFYNFDMF